MCSSDLEVSALAAEEELGGGRFRHQRTRLLPAKERLPGFRPTGFHTHDGSGAIRVVIVNLHHCAVGLWVDGVQRQGIRRRIGHLNHYALEMDDTDAIGRAGTRITRDNPDRNVVGIGRHYLGSNVFWYMRDPSGTMFELFCDMDQIADDDDWTANVGRRDWGSDGTPPPFSVWGPPEPPEFFRQPDLREIGAAREARGLR